MSIYNLDFVKELVNAFNVSNYGSKVNTNFVVEGDNIVVKFNCDQGSAKRYLSQMARDLVREYYSDESVARYAFDLGSLPFNFDKGKWTRSKAGTQLTVPIDNGVIFNLKVHFAEGFEIDVRNQVIKAIDEKHHLGKRRIEEILNTSIEQVEIDPSSGYIKCLLFNQPNVQTYFVKVLQEQIKKHYYTCSGFYDIDDNKVYFKDVENIGFVRSVTEASKKKVGYNFYLQHSDNLKVKAKHYKDAIGELIFSLTGISIYRYYYDEFIDKDRISNGDRFAFIPIVKEGNSLRYLNYMEADKINAKFSYDILTNVRSQTKNTESDEFGEVYALSDRQIALLIPVIIENSVINKDGQIEIDPGLYEKLQTPSTRLGSPRHESGVLPHVCHNVGAAEVGAAKNVQAGSSASSRWSSQSTSSGFSDSLRTQSGSSSNERPDSTRSADSGYSGSLERPQPNSSITTSAVPGISESGKGSNVAAVPVDNKRPQSLPLTENTPKPSSESPKKIIQQFFRNLSIRRSKSNGKATKDILQFDKETFSSFSSGMQKVLSLPLSLDMVRNLFPHFPIEKREKLILLARSEKVKKSHSSPKKIEQLLSSLLPEEQEICSLLFFPDRKNETYVDLSPGAKKQVVLFWEVLRGRGFTEKSGIFSGSSSQGSVSSELKHPQQVKHMSEALGK